MMDKTWYEVAVSSKTEGSATLESFDLLEDAKTFAFTMCNNSGQKLLGHIHNQLGWSDISLDDLEGLFIDRWTWDRENSNDLDETFTELRYEIKKGVTDD